LGGFCGWVIGWYSGRSSLGWLSWAIAAVPKSNAATAAHVRLVVIRAPGRERFLLPHMIVLAVRIASGRGSHCTAQ